MSFSWEFILKWLDRIFFHQVDFIKYQENNLFLILGNLNCEVAAKKNVLLKTYAQFWFIFFSAAINNLEAETVEGSDKLLLTWRLDPSPAPRQLGSSPTHSFNIHVYREDRLQLIYTCRDTQYQLSCKNNTLLPQAGADLRGGGGGRLRDLTLWSPKDS